MEINKKCHVMIDLETYSQLPVGVFRSIAAVLFDFNGNTECLMNTGVSIEDQLYIGSVMDQDTIDFWRKQPKENSDRLRSLPQINLGGLLSSLARYVKNSVEGYPYIWSHGSCFDVAILESAYRRCGLLPWWSYRHVRDTRTLFDLAEYEYKAKECHDALEDCMNQISGVVAAYKQLNQRKDTADKVQFLLDRFVETEEGKFCFPDGDIWDVKRRDV